MGDKTSTGKDYEYDKENLAELKCIINNPTIWFQKSYEPNMFNVIKANVPNGLKIRQKHFLSYKEIKELFDNIPGSVNNDIKSEVHWKNLKFRESRGGGKQVVRAIPGSDFENVSIISMYKITTDYENAYAQSAMLDNSIGKLELSNYLKQFSVTINSARSDLKDILKLLKDEGIKDVKEPEDYICVSNKMTWDVNGDYYKYQPLWSKFGVGIFENSQRDIFNPSDVFFIKKEYNAKATDETIPKNREEYNAEFLKGNIIGVSLKKHTKDSKIKLVSNCPKLSNCVFVTPDTFKYKTYEWSKNKKYPTLKIYLDVNKHFIESSNNILTPRELFSDAWLDFRKFGSSYSLELHAKCSNLSEAAWGKGWYLFKKAFVESKKEFDETTAQSYYNDVIKYILGICGIDSPGGKIENPDVLNLICAFCAHYPTKDFKYSSEDLKYFIDDYNENLCYYFKVY